MAMIFSHCQLQQTTNKINGKIYVGKHKTTNLNDGYLGSGKVLNYAINKYELYFIQEMSLGDICKLINYKPGPAPFANFMKSIFGKDALRSFSESSKLIWKQGKLK